jgi:hypothetical protein
MGRPQQQGVWVDGTAGLWHHLPASNVKSEQVFSPEITDAREKYFELLPFYREVLDI